MAKRKNQLFPNGVDTVEDRNIMINLIKTKPSQEDLVTSAESGPPSVDVPFPWTHLASINDGCTTVQVEKLDWIATDNTKLGYEEEGIDLLLGADIVYERSLIQPLVQVISNILRQNANANCYICCTERSGKYNNYWDWHSRLKSEKR